MNLGPLFESLSKAQGEFEIPKKNSVVKIRAKSGRMIEFSYADLQETIRCTQPALTKYGLAVTQPLINGVLYTILGHKSGCYLKCSQPINIKQEPKSVAADISYYRRYLRNNILGISADEDKDCEGVDGKDPQQTETTTPGGISTGSEKVTDKMLKRWFVIYKGQKNDSNPHAYKIEQVDFYIKNILKLGSKNELTKEKYKIVEKLFNDTTPSQMNNLSRKALQNGKKDNPTKNDGPSSGEPDNSKPNDEPHPSFENDNPQLLS